MADPTVNIPLLGTVPHKASGLWHLHNVKECVCFETHWVCMSNEKSLLQQKTAALSPTHPDKGLHNDTHL